MTVVGALLEVPLDRQTSRVHEAGYWALLALSVALPFEVTQAPRAVTHFDTFTDLKVGVWIVAALAAVSLAPPFIKLLNDAVAGRRQPTGFMYRHRIAIGVFTALVLSCVVSSFSARYPGDALRWTRDLVLGGAICLAVPLWLAENRERKGGQVCRWRGRVEGWWQIALVGSMGPSWHMGRSTTFSTQTRRFTSSGSCVAWP